MRRKTKVLDKLRKSMITDFWMRKPENDALLLAHRWVRG